MAIRLMNRPAINLQKPKSGVDLFFEEIAKYANPEYQLRKQAMEDRQEQYDDIQAQTIVENQRKDDEFKLKKKQFEENQLRNHYTVGSDYINTVLSESFSDSESKAKLTPDSPELKALLSGVDPSVHKLVKPRLLQIGSAGQREVDAYQNFQDTWNRNNPTRTMSEEDAKVLYNDKTAFNNYLNTAYFREEDPLNSREKGQITQNNNRISTMQSELTNINKNLATYLDPTSGMTDAKLETNKKYQGFVRRRDVLTASIAKLYQDNENILSPNNTGTTELKDAFDNDEETAFSYDPLAGSEPRLGSPYSWEAEGVMDVNYDNVFGAPVETQVAVLDNAELASRNATGENVDNVSMENIPPMWLEGADEDMDGNPIVKGLASAQAQVNPIPTNNQGDAELFPDKKEETKQFNVPSNLKDARLGSDFLKNKIKKLKKNIKISETAPNPTVRQMMKESMPKQIKELKDLFSSIYDESTGTFYDDNSEAIKKLRQRFPILKEKPLSYREFLGEEFINYINSL